MPNKMLPVEQMIPSLLAEAPRHIKVVTARLDPARSHIAPGEGEWSANEILAHLRACAYVWGGSIVTMGREDHPTIRAINPRTWIRDTDYLDRAFRPSLRAYTQQRTELLALLESLVPRGLVARGHVHGSGQAARTDRALRGRRDRAA